MRLDNQEMVEDHDLLQTGPDDHHTQADIFTILINSKSIAPGVHTERVLLPSSGYQTIRAILRGSQNVQIQGHVGATAIGSNSSAESTAIGILPYGAGGYLTSYIGGYSRLHGDTNLTHTSMFGSSIALRDVYVDDDEAVLVFFNASGSNKNLKVYGTGVVK
jgi:hypothetical protein